MLKGVAFSHLLMGFAHEENAKMGSMGLAAGFT